MKSIILIGASALALSGCVVNEGGELPFDVVQQFSAAAGTMYDGNLNREFIETPRERLTSGTATYVGAAAWRVSSGVDQTRLNAEPVSYAEDILAARVEIETDFDTSTADVTLDKFAMLNGTFEGTSPKASGWHSPTSVTKAYDFEGSLTGAGKIYDSESIGRAVDFAASGTIASKEDGMQRLTARGELAFVEFGDRKLLAGSSTMSAEEAPLGAPEAIYTVSPAPETYDEGFIVTERQ